MEWVFSHFVAGFIGALVATTLEHLRKRHSQEGG